MEDFTPVGGFVGGLLIGLAVALVLALNGRVAGISGIVGGPRSSQASCSAPSATSRRWASP